MKRKGTVYLVGAGPGDPGLLTVRAAELLGRADVVVYDSLVNADLLKLAPAEAETIYGGKRPERQAMSQDQLNQLLISKALEGKTVVRLRSRQEIFIPVYQDIVEFQSRRTKDMSSRNLITIVEENQIDRELVDQTLSSILGHNSTNLDPLQVLENVIEDEP